MTDTTRSAIERLIADLQFEHMHTITQDPTVDGLADAVRDLLDERDAAQAKAAAWDEVGSAIEAAAIGYNAPQIVKLVAMLRAAQARIREMEASLPPPLRT